MRRLFLILIMLTSSFVYSASTAQAQDLANICANTAIPAGWVLVGDLHNSFTCGSPVNLQVYNVWVIERYSSKTRDARMTVCYPVISGPPEEYPLDGS